MSSCDGVRPIVFEQVQIFLKVLPIPQAKALSIPLHSGHQPENWFGLCREYRPEEVSFYLLLQRLAATCPPATRLAATRFAGVTRHARLAA